MSLISLRGFDKAVVFAALYNAATPRGAGFLQYDPAPMTIDRARDMLASNTYGKFDYVAGRPVRVNLTEDDFSAAEYDDSNGAGATQRVMDSLRASGGDPNNEVIREMHTSGTTVHAMGTRAQLGDTSQSHGNHFTLGLDDLAEHLEPKLERLLTKR